jgi:ubiquinone/menaquinone biosynthesis C-methylase UbiE
VSELQHPESRSFELVAGLYERVRPEYPAEAIAWLADRLELRGGRTVLDLGAGTGKLTRALTQTGATVIAVEPGDAMRAELERALPEVEALRGSAERIPLDDGSVDAVAIGQAFHWFRYDEAIPELHRVLRPQGRVGLLWNARDQDDALQQTVTELLAPFTAGRARAENTSRHLSESGLFGALDHERFRFVQQLDADLLVDRITSISFVAAAPAEDRESLGKRLRALVPAEGTADFSYVTEVYVSQRVGLSATSRPPSSS